MQVSITFLWYAFCYRHLTSFANIFCSESKATATILPRHNWFS